MNGHPCGTQSKEISVVAGTKLVCKKWRFWVMAAVVVLGMMGSAGCGEDIVSDLGTGSSVTQSGDEANRTADSSADSQSDSNTVTVTDFSAMSQAEIENWAETNKVTVQFREEYSDTVASGSVISQNKKADETVPEGATIKVVISKGQKPSIEYQNALKKAETYSEVMHMSKQAIYDQLTSEYGEKFPAEAAQYAIDHLEADYKANALAQAKTYQQTMSMSKSAIYDQLISEYGEQFTAEEAQYAIDHLDD